MLLHTREPSLGLWTGADTKEIARTSRLVSRLTGYPVQPNKAIVGRNAFAHEAGIHQDGVLKERTTYEIIDPKTVGVPESRLVLGKHSGRHALKVRVQDLGLTLDKEQLDDLYTRFSALSDTKKGITDDEIRTLAQDVVSKVSRKIA